MSVQTIETEPMESVRVLLSEAIDYAGLFSARRSADVRSCDQLCDVPDQQL